MPRPLPESLWLRNRAERKERFMLISSQVTVGKKNDLRCHALFVLCFRRVYVLCSSSYSGLLLFSASRTLTSSATSSNVEDRCHRELHVAYRLPLVPFCASHETCDTEDSKSYNNCGSFHVCPLNLCTSAQHLVYYMQPEHPMRHQKESLQKV